MSERAVPFYCPYCGEEDLRPAEVSHGAWYCPDCLRTFSLKLVGIGTKGAWIGGEHWVAAAHTDGSILNPSIYLDGVAIEEEGTYVHPELVRICRELGVAGY